MKKDGLISCLYNEYLTFRNGIYSIHAPKAEHSELQALAKYIEENGKLLCFLITAISGRLGIIKVNSFYNEDIENLPYPEDTSLMAITETDAIVINDTLKYFSTPRKQSVHKQLFQETIPFEELLSFADVFCNGINSIFNSKEEKYSLAKIIDAENYYGMQFEFRKADNNQYVTESNKDISNYLKSMLPVYAQQAHTTHIQKIMKICGDGVIILIKPKQRRYWLKSLALRDSDDLFAENIQMLNHA